MLPHQARTTTRHTILGHGPFSVFKRRRTSTGAFAVFSESRHRNAAYRITGIPTETADPAADALATGRTGAIILYAVTESESDALTRADGHEIDPPR